MPSHYVQNVELSRGTVGLPRRFEEVLERIAELKQARDQVFTGMYRTANILDGGERAVQALVGDQTNLGAFRDLPIANYMQQVSKTLAQRLGAIPDLRVDPPSTGRKADDSETRRKQAEKRARICLANDDADRLDQLLPQLGRWCPGAGYAVATFDPDPNADPANPTDHPPYARTTLHSPLDTMLAQWTSIQKAEDCGIVSKVPVRELKHHYPHVGDKLDRLDTLPGTSGAIDLSGRQRDGMGVEVVRYYDRHGTWRFVPDKDLLLDFTANPLRSGPSFVAFVKFNYGRLRGEFDDGIGLMISMARLTIMAEVAVRQNITAPTNLFGGEPLSGPYKKGFNSTNVFDAQQRVEIPRNTIQFEAWQQLDRLERSLRMETTHPTQDSGESPMSFVTGRGLQELNSSVGRQVEEYQTIFARGLRDRDSKLLEYDDREWPSLSKPMHGTYRGASFSETYTPERDIKGNYATNREYGALSGLDEASKLNGLSIMDAAGWVSKSWVRHNVPGMGDVTKVEEQIRNEEATMAFRQMLLTHANNAESPEHMRALQIIVEQLPAGPDKELAQKWLTEKGEALAEEEQAMLEQAQAQQQGPAAGMPPPDPATVMSALTASGAPRGGPQIVRDLAG